MSLLRPNPMNSRMAEGVGRVGFRKWYERELLSSHAYLVLAFLSVIGLIGSMEAFGLGSNYDKVTNVVSIVVCAVVGAWSLRRYLFLLMRAEEVANQANCSACGEYGRFTVVGEDRSRAETEVRCRKCSHRWTISVID
ncbi:hypothetical protein [Caenimonas soli]|uniref:hypothetical protein n=1 Tax=Caenimonas soli TaxID=2735555 RepID=UPI001554BB25|nr:hypothetical protein [Caenimonas soli]NPC56606.1 hypothetical protein [Caenimonas soli]